MKNILKKKKAMFVSVVPPDNFLPVIMDVQDKDQLKQGCGRLKAIFDNRKIWSSQEHGIE